nr:hypothetical protein BaRGS_028901 [Batillaria attramentaria]
MLSVWEWLKNIYYYCYYYYYYHYYYYYYYYCYCASYRRFIQLREAGVVEWRLRGLVIDLACKHYDPACLSNATARFRDWLDRGIDPPVNLKSLVYKWGMWAGGSAADWEELWRRYKREVVPQEKINLLRALAMTKSPWLLAKLLGSTKAGVDIRRQDFIVVVQLIAVNPAGRTQLFDWVRQNWEDFVDR